MRALKRLSGTWPLPCPICQAEMSIERYIDHDRDQTTNHFFCPCGLDLVLRRRFDPEHDLLPFPHPRPALAAPAPHVPRVELLLEDIVGELKALNQTRERIERTVIYVLPPDQFEFFQLEGGAKANQLILPLLSEVSDG